MKQFKAEIEDDNFEIIFAKDELEAIEQLDLQGHTVLEIEEYNEE